MAQTKSTGLRIEDLKKSLKTLTSEMNPDQLKRANETLEKLESVTIKNNDENVEIQKTNVKIEKSLSKNGDLNKTLLGLQKLYKDNQKEDLKHNKQVLAKLDRLGANAGINKVAPIRDDKAITVREGLKSVVAGAKGAVSSVGRGIGAIGSGIRDVFTKPGDVLGKIKGKAVDALEATKDVLSTREDYTVRGGRFSEAYATAKADERDAQGGSIVKNPTLMRRIDKNVGAKNYREMMGIESQLRDTEGRIKESKTYGFDAAKVDIQEKESLSKQHRDLDIRNTLSNKSAAEKANEIVEKTSIDVVKKARDENPEGDNIESPAEVVAKNSEEDLTISRNLLDTTKQQLDTLKEIQKAFGTDKEKVDPKKKYEPLLEKIDELKKIIEEKDFGGSGGGSGLPKIPKLPTGVSPAPATAASTAAGAGSAAMMAATLGTVAIGGAAASYGATGLLAAQTEHRKAYSAKEDPHGMLSAMSGDTGIAANILDANQGQSPEDVRAAQQKEQDQLKNAPWYTRLYGIGKSSYLRENQPAAEPNVGTGASGFPLQEAPNVSTGASGFPLAGNKLSPAAAASRARWDRKAERIHSVNEETKAGTYKTEAEKAGITNPAETAAGTKIGSKGGPNWEAAKKDLERGLPSPGSPDYEVQKKILELAQSSTPRSDSFQTVQMHLNTLRMRAQAAVAGIDKKSGKATYKDSNLVQTTAAQSPDPQLDQDIKANQKRAAKVTPTKPSTKSGELSNSSLEYTDLDRERSQSKPTPAPIIMNNSSSNSTTKVMPMKADPRPSDRGSAYERHIDRTSAY